MNDYTDTSERPVKPKPRARSFLIALVLLALTFGQRLKFLLTSLHFGRFGLIRYGANFGRFLGIGFLKRKMHLIL